VRLWRCVGHFTRSQALAYPPHSSALAATFTPPSRRAVCRRGRSSVVLSRFCAGWGGYSIHPTFTLHILPTFNSVRVMVSICSILPSAIRVPLLFASAASASTT
jgi:hypothetical protein